MVLSRRQQVFIVLAVLAIGCQAIFWGWRDSVITLTALPELFYFVFVGFKVILAVASFLPGIPAAARCLRGTTRRCRPSPSSCPTSRRSRTSCGR